MEAYYGAKHGLETLFYRAKHGNEHAALRRPQTDYGKFGEAVERLPKFTDDSADEWWKAARVVFLFTYPKPETIPELAKLVKPLTKRRSPGRMKQAILDLLKARFIGFAPAASAYPT